MNRQARAVGCPEWTDYGNVTLFEAGRLEAFWHAAIIDFAETKWADYEIEVRDADDPEIPVSSNTYRVKLIAEVLDGRKGCDDERDE